MGLHRAEKARGRQEEAGADGFKYLLSMKMWSLTENRVEDGQEWACSHECARKELRAQHENKRRALEELKGRASKAARAVAPGTAIEELWERDLLRGVAQTKSLSLL